MGKTTNFTKEDEFHPSCIIAVITGYKLPPYTLVGITELVTYVTEGRRESPPIDYGNIIGYYFSLVSRAGVCSPFLQQQFPEIAKYSKGLTESQLNDICSSESKIADWISKIESRFGKSIQVNKIPAKQAQKEFVNEQSSLPTQIFTPHRNLHKRKKDDEIKNEALKFLGENAANLLVAPQMTTRSKPRKIS